MSDGNVRFVRIRGRVVPIRGKGGEKVPAKPKTTKVMIGVATRDIGAGERFKSGFKGVGQFGAILGGMGGAVGGAMASKGGMFKMAGGMAAGALGGAVGTGLLWGGIGGVANSIVGKRKETRIIIAKRGK